MSEMVERVADALVVKLGPALNGGPPVTVRDVARAAIEAMREPTEAMSDQIIFADWCPTIPQGNDLYRAMIDAALGN